ncbi:nucleotidyl transferase AbiEii/AbiGii toxin family protein [Flavobacterium sp. H122]|uniref:nucleotidyl transferase AbiEii/AbiGii toxin family protein n=1 Tax=Flavobacterium sp. H122 TaxID=2529860 RepID=UPI0010AAD4CA|nr:nucleotidyl transferase AbiEii/AbiGii toxin family protein [Flavobacterium sp. H122]
MIQNWDEEIKQFIILCDKFNVRMLMVGGGAVNFHGYQRHSADIDFWIETTSENFEKLVFVFKKMGYEIDDFPNEVKNQEQNISVKFSPNSLNLELITRFSVNKSFETAYNESEKVIINDVEIIKWNVLSLEDLITSKIKSGRPKDLLDIQELKIINNKL